MSVALDLGSHRFRSLRRDGGRLVARRCRSVYAVLPDNNTQRQLLARSDIPFAACEGHLLLLGDAAAELASSFQTPCCDLLPGGVLPQSDPIARQVISLLIDALLPPSHQHALCCYTQPLHALRRHGGTTGQNEFFARLIRLRGYEPRLVSAGLSLISAEMRSEAFTGIGFVAGASGCEISVAHQGRELVACSVPRGGTWIDQHLARARKDYGWNNHGEQFLDVELAAREKETTARSLLAPQTPQEKLLAVLYADLIGFALTELSRELEAGVRPGDLPQSLSIVCDGGPTRIPGFCELLSHQCGQIAGLPQISTIRLAPQSQDTIARGCLIHAELEASLARGVA